MKCDLDHSTKTNRLIPIAQGQTYSLLSCAKSKGKVKPVNFITSHIKINDKALKEINRVRTEAMFSWKHPAEMLSS